MLRFPSAAMALSAVLACASVASPQSQTPAPTLAAEQNPPPPAPDQSADHPRSPAAEPSRTGMKVGWQDGLYIESEDGEYQVRIGALLRFDGRFATSPPPGAPIDTFTMRTVRTAIQGRVTRYFVYRLVPDFTSTSSSLADAYVDVGLSEALHLRIGRDKTPLGFETLLQDANVLFMERGLTLNLIPGRDVGLQVYGDVARGMVSYVGGVFNGFSDGGIAGNLDTDNGKEILGRAIVRPFNHTGPPVLRKLGVALAGSREDQQGPLALPVFRTSIQQPYFSYAAGTVADGLHTRISPQIFHYYRSFGFYAEYVRSRQVVRKADVDATIDNRAWQVTSSIIATGETAGERIHPKHPFDPERHTWGALQLVARYGSMTLDPGAFALGMADSQSSRQAQVATIGGIWFLTANVKALFDVERSVFDRNPRGARPVEHGILFRLQLNF